VLAIGANASDACLTAAPSEETPAPAETPADGTRPGEDQVPGGSAGTRGEGARPGEPVPSGGAGDGVLGSGGGAGDGIMPDTASVLRAGRVLLTSALPLAVLLVGMTAYAVLRRRRDEELVP
jgi:hypothetical protein